ncbi:MAG: cytochrome c biogenesis protein CcsA [Acidobacteriota bacterium]|jgi:cytochrome c-type biogenesis protein CcmF
MPSSIYPGPIFLLVALAATLFSIGAAWRWHRGRLASRRNAEIAVVVALASLATAFGLLLIAFLGDDFRLSAVVNYSSRDLPLLYKVSAVWAGQEGSLLLWAAMASALALLLIRPRSNQEPLALAIFQGAQAGLLFILIQQAPFRAMAQRPPDGNGLNPLLQDPWMATHPPVVFLGYAAAGLPFALALAAIWRGDRDRWLATSLRFNLVTVLTLGIGILLGAFWAYEVLGWGGYWGWDPVENSSLIPWIAAVALAHGLLVQRRTGALVRMNLILALATYILVLYATFLTRSGVLAAVSVHSFPQGGIFAPLLTLITLLTGVGVVSLVWRWRQLPSAELSWRLDLGTVLAVSAGLLLLSAGLILGGTSWPIVSGFLGEPMAPKPDFYNRSNLPVYLLLSALLVAAPLLGWKAIPFRRLARVSVVPVVTGFGIAGWCFAAGIRAPAFLGLTLFAGAAIGSCLVRTVRVARHAPLKVGAPLAHIGLAAVFLGVLISAVGERREQVDLPLGEEIPALGTMLRFDGPPAGDRAGESFQVVLDPEGAATPAVLQLVQTKGGEMQHKPAILRTLKGDVYLSPVGVQRTPRLARNAVLQRGVPVEVDGETFLFEQFGMQDHSDHMAVTALIRTGSGAVLQPTLVMAAGGGRSEPATIPATGLKVALTGMNVESGQIGLRVIPPGVPRLLRVEASWKPGMNLLWGGALLLCLGTGIAFFHRRPEFAAAIDLGERTRVASPARGRRRPERAAARVPVAPPGR